MKPRPLPTWESLSVAPFEDAAEVLSNAAVWEDLGAPRSFLEPFASKSSWLARKKAMICLVPMRYLRESMVIEAAETLRQVGSNTDNASKMVAESRRRFLADFVAHSEPESLRKLADAMESANSNDGKGKGGPESPEGEVWAAFVLWALNHKSIPTYEQLRESVGFQKGSNARDKKFSGYVKNLGLSGISRSP